VCDVLAPCPLATIVYQAHVKQLLALSVSPNGHTIATGSDDNTSVIWDLRGRRVAYTILAHSSLVSGVKYVLGVAAVYLLVLRSTIVCLWDGDAWCSFCARRQDMAFLAIMCRRPISVL
jgi:WD40 repeat protein